ncbi:MAG: hypothetical protein JNK60_03460 [Acidobacteria bacterium]|nr:hypothetical protein [Acidobacteriota bacterium]
MSTGEDGFRTVPGRPSSGRAVVLLGDSCTFGLGVNDDESVPAALQKLRPDLRVVNAGVPGYSAFQGRRLFARNGSGWKPDLVFITFGFNDATAWDGSSDRDQAKRAGRKSGVVPWLLTHSRFAQMVQGIVTSFSSLRPAPDPTTLRPPTDARPRLTPQEFEEEIRGLAGEVRAGGAKPVLVVWPARASVAGRQTPEGAHQDVLRRLSATETVVDLLPVFQGAPNPEGLYVDAVHGSARASEVAAKALSLNLGVSRSPQAPHRE